MWRSAAPSPSCPIAPPRNDQTGARIRRRPIETPNMELRVGSVEVGRHADPALWSPTFMGVKPDGELLTCEPAEVLPMAQRCFLF